jgi:hypothetical protein
MFNLNKKLTSVALLAMTSIGGSIVNISSISAQIQPAESSTEAVTTTTADRYNRNINPQLKPGADEKLYLISPAKGVQIYQCQSQRQARTYPKYQSYKYEWKFEAPEADLYDRRGYSNIGKHYGGPTWEGNDGSKVVGAVKASVNYSPNAIPWLLLNAANTQGNGIFGKISSLQRLDTVGGKAPTSGCNSQTSGTKVRVPYTANYYFYQKK